MRNIWVIKSELRDAADRGLAAVDRGDYATSEAAEEMAVALSEELRTAERQQAIASIGDVRTMDAGVDLAGALLDAGFDRRSHPSVTVENPVIQFKTGGIEGGVDGTEVVGRFPSPALGLDSRYVHVHLTTVGVPPDETGIQSYRQASRSLASTSDMLRDIADTTGKPETDTSAEVVSEPLMQIASVSTGTPNVLLQNVGFRSWVNNDLLGAYRHAVDAHVISQIGDAGIAENTNEGNNIYEAVEYASEVLLSGGYSPNLVALSPADALEMKLLIIGGAGPSAYVFGATLPPNLVVTRAISDGEGFVADTTALGTLYVSPFTLAVFEESAGTTNSSTVRGESNGLFLVQRPTAACALSAGS